MPAKTRQVIVGKYGRPRKRVRRFNFCVNKKFFCFTILIAIVGGIFYFFFVSDRFEIKEIKISGVETVVEGEVVVAINTVLSSRKFGFLKSKNYFLFSDDKLRAHILSAFPKISTVVMDKTLGQLNIAVKEREIIGIWCLAFRETKSDERRECFYFDKEGVIFEQAPRSLGSLMIVVEDRRNIEAKLASRVLAGDQIIFIQEARAFISRNFPFGVQVFVIGEDGDFEIVTSENWRILLNKNETPKNQLSNLKYVLDGEIKTRRMELEYIDLRLGNRVYYKWAEEGTLD